MQTRNLTVLFRFSALFAFSLMRVLPLAASAQTPLAAPTPQFTLTATNVSVSDTGSGVSNITLTSLNGFTGTVGVSCSAPTTLATVLVLPNCTFPVKSLLVPANGSVTGTLPFVPPSNVTASAANRQRQPAIPAPLKAAVVAACLLGLGFRKRFPFQGKSGRWMGSITLATATLGLTSLMTLTGCIGRGGLAMSPGTYSYVIQAANGVPAVTTFIQVTVNRP
jgi:hypothetical protein